MRGYIAFIGLSFNGASESIFNPRHTSAAIVSQRHDKETILVDLNDRGRAEEAKVVLSEEVRFQAEARRNKRVGLWFASEILGLSGDEQQAFAAGVMDADFEESGTQDVIRFLRQQAENAGKIFDESAVLAKMSAEHEAALQELVPKS